MAADVGGGPVPRFLGEEQFGRLYVLPQGEAKIHTKGRERERLFLEALCWLARRGARWDDLGVRARLLAGVADDPGQQRVMIDATVVRAHARAAGAPQETAARARGR